MAPDVRRDVADLFEVFEPWTEPEAEPWVPPAPSLAPPSHPVLSQPQTTHDGAVEPARVIPAPPSMQQPRRRIGPRIAPPAAPPIREADPVDSPAEFLRSEGIPEIGRAAQRLGTVDHQLQVQDLLDLPDAALRVLFWPRPGAMSVSGERVRGTLEFNVSGPQADEISARYWVGEQAAGVTPLGSTPTSALELGWLRGRVLDFIEAVLKRV